MGNLSSEQIELIIKNTRATMAVEGLEPSKETEEISRQYLAGIINEKQALTEIHKIIEKLSEEG